MKLNQVIVTDAETAQILWRITEAGDDLKSLLKAIPVNPKEFAEFLEEIGEPDTEAGQMILSAASQEAYQKMSGSEFPNDEEDSLLQYFRKLMMNAKEEGFPELRLVQDAENVWLDLKKRFGNQLLEPQAALALDGSLMFTWRRPGHYLEIEVFPDGHKEAFYENEITGTPWEAKITPSASLTDCVLEKLSIFMLDKVHLN